jgi:sugar transferase EpsL
MLKRLLDFCLGIVLFVLLYPFMVIIYILILFKMGKPVLFKQFRPGFKGKAFTLYKFRTMTDAVDGEGSLLNDEDRLTNFGRWLRKYSIDELPQLFNVVRGDLSFVGPRPLLMDYLERYSPEQARRHEVKPGITGWAQVNGRNAISWEEKFKLDVWYVDNCSLWVDTKILWLTLVKVIRAEGISGGESSTMSEFLGTNQGADPFGSQ